MRLYSLTISLLMTLSAFALEVTVDGTHTLADALTGADPSTTTLSINGTMPASDLSTLRESLPKLATLDLSNATLTPSVIPDYAFAGTTLTSFTAPTTLTAIGEASFAATQLGEFIAPASLSDVGRYAFAHCHRLSTVTLGQGVTTIGDYAFTDCPTLENLTLTDAITSIGSYAFQGSGLADIDLSRCSRLAEIGDYAFAGSPWLNSLTLPGHSLTVGDAAVAFCRSLTAVNGLAGVTTMPSLFAADSPKLRLNFAETGLTAILDHALYGVGNPQAITLPSTLTRLGRHAMASMTGLVLIDARQLSTVPDVDDDVWLGLDKSTITLQVAEGMEDAFRAAPQWRDFNISLTSGSVDVIADDATLTLTALRSTVTARSTTSTVTSLTVYLPDGRIAAILSGTDDTLSVDLNDLAGRGVIVVATDADGRRSTLSTILTH